MKQRYLLIGLLFLIGCGGGSTTPAPKSTSPAVSISWTIAADGVDTFFIYRNDQSLFASPLAITSFVDSNVVVGSQYCYYVEATQNGISGPPSNTECVTIPSSTPAVTVQPSNAPAPPNAPVIPAYETGEKQLQIKIIR